MGRYVVGVSGASGVVIAHRLLAYLSQEHQVELVMSRAALYTAAEEMGREFATAQKFLSGLPHERITLHSIHDVGASICSGSYPVDGMAIVPCSMATLAAIACGLGDNALRRAADVTLKERRPLVVVPRETPVSEIHLENMLKLSRMGARMVLPVPAWYTGDHTLEATERFIVGKILEGLGVGHRLYRRWKLNGSEEADQELCFDGR